MRSTMVSILVVVVALVGGMASAGAAREPAASVICELAAARGCPMMQSPGGPPMGPWAGPPAPRDLGSSPGATGPAPLPGTAERGRRVYLARCTACHSPDPGRNGPVGPAIKGSSMALVRARVLQAAYPPGYVPKRPTRIMPPQPDLAPWIADLAAFLRAQ
jgi:mono/diheme cytochrome c family protein